MTLPGTSTAADDDEDEGEVEIPTEPTPCRGPIPGLKAINFLLCTKNRRSIRKVLDIIPFQMPLNSSGFVSTCGPMGGWKSARLHWIVPVCITP